MVAETKVQYICEENLNAPNLPDTWNSLIAVLDAALVTGLNLPAINTVEVDGSVIFINFSSAHQLKMFQVISLSGFTPVELNAKWRIIGVPTNQQIAIDRLDYINAITTIGTARLPPLGYEKTFSAIGKGVYRNANAEAEHRPFLRVDATLPANWTTTYAKFARVAVMTECTGIDDITSQYQLPFDTSNPDKNWKATGSGASATTFWAKWIWSGYYKDGSTNPLTSSYSGNRKWAIVGDENAFYLILQDQSSNGVYQLRQGICGFGVYNKIDEAIEYPYFLASFAATPATADGGINPITTNLLLPFCGSYNNNYLYNPSVYVMGNGGSTAIAQTAFGKHATNQVGGNTVSPHYVQFSSALKGIFPHIFAPHGGFGTGYNASKIINGSMFYSTPACYRLDNPNTSQWYSILTEQGMPFYLGEL